MWKFRFLLLILIGPSTIYGSELDSLKTAIKNARTSDDRYEGIVNLSLYYEDLEDFENAMRSLTQGIKFFPDTTDLHNLSLRLDIGNLLLNSGEYSLAIKQLSEVANLAAKMDMTGQQQRAERFLGYAYLYNNDFELATKVFLSQKVYHEKHNNREELSIAFSDLGVVNYYTKNYDKCAHFWEEELKLNEGLNKMVDVCGNYSNLGLIYLELHKPDLAELALQNANRLADSLDLGTTKIDVLTNLGKLEFERNNFEKAEEYLVESFHLLERFGNPRQLVNGYINVGTIFYNNGKYDQAKKYIDLGYEVSKENHLLEYQMNSYISYAGLYSMQNQYELAYLYMDSANSYQDSVLTVARLNQISELEAKYELRQKADSIQIATQQIAIEKNQKSLAEKKAKMEQEENKEKTIYLFGAVVLLVLAAGMIALVIRSNRLRSKANKLLSDQKAIIEQKNQDITDSIEYARHLQDAIMPDDNEINRAIKNLVLLYEPRDIVSGDFYWFQEKNDKVFLAIADCTGHGVPGAFIAMLCVDSFNKVVNTMDVSDPGEILTKVNISINDVFMREGASFKANDGMDVSLCVIDKKTMNIEFSSAMNKLVLIRDQEIIEYRGDKTPIGGRTDPSYNFSTTVIPLEEGDRFYMFSDGYMDQFGGEYGKKFMYKRMKEMLVEIHRMNPQKQREEMMKRLLDWQGEYQRVDDILVAGFEI